MSNPLAKLREECQGLLEKAAGEAYLGTRLPKTKYCPPPHPPRGGR